MNLDINSSIFSATKLKVSRLRARLNDYMQIARRNPIWFAMFIFGRFVVFRSLAHIFLPVYQKRCFNYSSKLFPDLSTDLVVFSLRDKGIFLGVNLTSDVLEQILSFAESNVCFANSDKTKPISVNRHGIFSEASGTVVIADYHDQIFSCHAIENLCNDGALMRIAGAYLQAPPQLTRCRLWWSFNAPQASQQQLNTAGQDFFHFDMDDWKCLKFFFYLTEVDEQAGPHCFIRYSHRRRKLRHQFTLFKGHSLEKLEKVYPPEDFLTITGPAGFGFAEDPFGFHTGTPVRAQPRLILEIECGVTQLPVPGRYGFPIA
jgi:hypothetical protein